MKINKTVKVPKGKLLTIKSEITNNKIFSLKITGDFFVYPEEGLCIIENSLINTNYEKEKVKKNLIKILKTHKIKLFGLTIDSIINCLFYESPINY